MSGSQTSGGTGSFVERRLGLIYSLGLGDGRQETFGDEQSDTIKFMDHAISATVTKPGGVAQGALELQIFGLPLSLINKMSRLGPEPNVVNEGNQVTLLAGTPTGVNAVVFRGTVNNTFPDLNQSPNVPLVITAFGALAEAQMNIPPTSIAGNADVAGMMQTLAKQMGLTFENNGVSVRIANPCYPGSALAQAERLAQHANIHMVVDDQVLAIWPVGGYRKGKSVPLISAETGMVGYPTRNQLGIDVRTIYNPAIVFGATVEVKSILIPACGTWQVAALTHNLASQIPDGPWFSTLSCWPLGYL